jgi:DNA helicase HerA-like ATPase
MPEPFVIAKSSDGPELGLVPRMANRHGLITGATGTGKTVTLQLMADNFSRIGVPVFVADVKGDLSGLAVAGSPTPKLKERLARIGIPEPPWAANPVVFWDLLGGNGFPVRATVSDMGPMLLGRLLALNPIQQGVLTLVFKIADDSGLLILDSKDLRSMLQFVGDNAKTFTTEYGNVSAASIGAIQRGLLELEQQGADHFFGEPMLDIQDLLQTEGGRGIVNLLVADQLIRSPKTYSTFLLWLLSELFERLPEAGDPDKPNLVFFFDEAHLLFTDAPSALVEKIEQVVRLIRSKGVGVYFVTQSPGDIPDTVLAQLGNRVQHALRAFTPRDQKAVRTAAQTLRANPKLDTEQAIMELAVGEALVSLLDEKGTPAVVERAWILPPASQIGPIDAAQRTRLVEAMASRYGHYRETVDRESAYERLTARSAEKTAGGPPTPADSASPTRAPAGAATSGGSGSLVEILLGSTGPRGGRHQGILEQAARSAARSVGSGVGREILRGILGSMLGKRRR